MIPFQAESIPYSKTHNHYLCNTTHFLPPHFKTAIVAIHQLPNTPETALLRVLGKGTKQTAAIVELLKPQEWPADDPNNLLRQRVSSVLHAYLLSLQKQAGSTEEQVVLMSLLALHEQWERETLWRGQQEGLLKGQQEGRQEVVQTLLKTRFGPDDTLLQRLDVLLQMPLAELLPWLLTVSKDELRAKLG